MLTLRHLPLRYRRPLTKLALGLLARWRARGWRKAAPADVPVRGDLVVTGFFNEALGIGRAGRLTAEALRAAGYTVIEHDLRPAFRHIRDGRADLPGEGGVWLIHANAPEVMIAMLAHPAAQWNDRYRIGYWAWETARVPASWLYIADYLHEIWVPSRFVHDALARSLRQKGREDLIVRIRMMPHLVPVPAQDPNWRHDARARFGLDPDLCEVLCLFDTKSSAVRKNPWGALDAWQQAFPEPSTTARLTLKVVDLAGDRPTEQKLLAILAGRPDIRLVSERFDDQDMDAFIAAFDVLMSLHRSEGFGLTLAEAMAAGVAVIATAGSGNDDFMTGEAARLVPSHPVRVHDPEGPYGDLAGDREQTWGEPDIAAAAAALRELAGSRALRDAMAAHGPEAIRALQAPWQDEALAVFPFNAWIRR